MGGPPNLSEPAHSPNSPDYRLASRGFTGFRSLKFVFVATGNFVRAMPHLTVFYIRIRTAIRSRFDFQIRTRSDFHAAESMAPGIHSSSQGYWHSLGC